MRPHSYRVTVEILRSGQPGPYQDTEYVCMVMFEHVPWNTKTGEFEPHYYRESDVPRELQRIPGFIGERNPDDPFATKLDYIKGVGTPVTAADLIEGGDPHSKMWHTWEFRTISRFTD